MLKILGAVCIIGAAGLLGYTKSHSLQQHIRQMKALRQICMELNGELSVGRIPLYEILLRISNKSPSPFCEFLRAVCFQMMAYEGLPFSEIFIKQTGRLLKDVFTAQELESWKQVGSYLTISDRQVQIGLMRLYEKELDRTIEGLEKTRKEKQKLYQTLGLMGGIMVTILLL